MKKLFAIVFLALVCISATASTADARWFRLNAGSTPGSLNFCPSYAPFYRCDWTGYCRCATF